MILSIDIGTSKIKAAIFNCNSNLISQTKLTVNTPQDKSTTLSPLDILKATNNLVDDLLQRNKKWQFSISTICMTYFATSIIGINKNGTPLTPLFTYADKAPLKFNSAKIFRNRLNIQNMTGCKIHSSYYPIKLLNLKENYKKIFPDIDKFIDIGTFIYTQWFGFPNIPCSFSSASWTGMFNRYSTSWHLPLLKSLNIKTTNLPNPKPNNTKLTKLSGKYSSRWPSIKNATFFLPIPDGVTANIGTNCIGENSVALSIGSTSAIRCLTNLEIKKIPQALWVYVIDSHVKLLGGALNQGSNVITWIKNNLLKENFEDLNIFLENTKPGNHKLFILPYFSGERSPNWSTIEGGHIGNLQLSTTSFDIAQSILESLAIQYAIVTASIEKIIGPNFNLIASGGGTNLTPQFFQLIADATGHKILLAKELEASLKGNAILANSYLNRRKITNQFEIPLQKKHYLPNLSNKLYYKKETLKHKRLYNAYLKQSQDFNS
jgi:gluconokinase